MRKVITVFKIITDLSKALFVEQRRASSEIYRERQKN